MTDVCTYCGLSFRASSRPDAAEPLFCCYGCRLAASITKSSGAAGQATWTLTRLGAAILLTMNVMAFTTLMYGGHVYAPGQTPVSAAETTAGAICRYLSLFFTIPVVLLLGGPIAANALRDLRARRVNADLLIVLGVVAAFFYSYVSVMLGRDTLYFDTACMTLVLVTLGKYLEAVARLRTSAALTELRSMLPACAHLADPTAPRDVPVADIRPHDRVRVLPGERVPVDGRIVEGAAFVDEQILTGESRPVSRQAGDPVHAGTLNTDGELLITALSEPGRTTLAHVIELLESARRSRGRHQRLADTLSAWFVPVVVSVALAAGVWRIPAGIDHALMTALAVLLISCPCALGLATPMAIAVALGRAARRGVMFRDVDALESLAAVRRVFFDKTGTLTSGRPRLSQFQSDASISHVNRPPTSQSDLEADAEFAAAEQLALAAAEQLALSTAGGLAQSSKHHFCTGLASFVASRGVAPAAVLDVRPIAGRGLLATRGDGQAVGLGSPVMMQQYGYRFDPGLRARLDELMQRGESVTCLGWGDRVRAVFSFQEELRPGAAPCMDTLRRLKIDAHVLTGDHEARARLLGDTLGVPVEGALLPDAKVDRVRAASAAGRAAMVGDGINDAPALAAATVGIALGCGADVARESAQVCLMHDDPLDVPWSIELARAAVRIIRQNLFWCFVYNVVGIALAAAGILTPVYAAISMVVSSLLVVGNSLRLDRSRLASEPRPEGWGLPSEPQPEGRGLASEPRPAGSGLSTPQPQSKIQNPKSKISASPEHRP